MADPRALGKVIRDPVHDYIEVPRELAPLVASPAVQRLRNISQNSLATAAYPSMNGSRFEHALGTMHFARLGWSFAWLNAGGANLGGGSVPREAFRKEIGDELRSAVVGDWSRLDFVPEILRQGHVDAASRAISDDFDGRNFERAISLVVGAVGLLHDVGHPPFSHVLEPFYEVNQEKLMSQEAKSRFEAYRGSSNGGDSASPKQFHEWAGSDLALQLSDEVFEHLPRYLILRVLLDRGESGWSACLHALIDGQFDVDRLDYLIRDARRGGTGYDAMDYSRLLQSLELHDLHESSEWSLGGGASAAHSARWRVGLGVRSVSAYETLLLQRAQSYRWVIHHPQVVFADHCLLEACQLAVQATTVPDVVHSDTQQILGPLPHLDYVSALRHENAESIDDSDVRVWLKLVRRTLLAHRVSHAESRSTTERFEALARVCLDMRHDYFTAWRNYQEMRSAAEEFFMSHSGSSERSNGAAMADESDTELAEPLVQGDELSAAVSKALSATSVPQINRMFAHVGPDLLSSTLNESFNVVNGVSGTWFVVRRKFNAVKSKYAVVFVGQDPHPLSDYSPITASLKALEMLRVEYFVFFLPFAVGTQPQVMRERRGAERKETSRIARIALEELQRLYNSIIEGVD